ncbi:hypothetical protein A9P82_05975 [Arachidicoccus ginsenosidimutans]|uniref:hypothetical protein n=1 Tax=Arachidicoccus sp. BS20 TaxID=1850526 RepID=UPI0007F1494A|nr:hypothetical protein [Arachidicoccus sp. BS20]ANI88879.1 hypothetical protein A9P82_05975 [Arachidicoccus sp. BS20]
MRYWDIVGYWLSVIGYQLLVISYWLWVGGGCSVREARQQDKREAINYIHLPAVHFKQKI